MWTDDEMIEAGLGVKSARRMGHVPMSGDGGSLDGLAGMEAPQARLCPYQQHEPGARRGIARAGGGRGRRLGGRFRRDEDRAMNNLLSPDELEKQLRAIGRQPLPTKPAPVP